MYSINCKGKLLLFNRPLVMGIINATPDSFFKGDLNDGLDGIVARVVKMLADGAAIIDVGGQSTKPGSKQLTADEEAERVLPVIRSIIVNFPGVIISVDTFYSQVAEQAVAAGACIINDISAGNMDEGMITTAARLQVPYICMHMKGTPATMQQNPQYENVVTEVLDYFIQKIAVCKKAGIKDIIIDPGFGFGKTIHHNFELLKNLSLFKMTEVHILAGLSRKGTIYKTLGVTAEEALNGTTVLNTIALMNGAAILRVHDVREAVETVALFQETYR